MSLFYSFDEQNYTLFNQAYVKDRSALTFLSNYEANDVAAVVLGMFSLSFFDVIQLNRIS